jgi:hypothetical protein
LVDVWIQEEKPASTNESTKYRRMTKQRLGVLQQYHSMFNDLKLPKRGRSEMAPTGGVRT